ncbi:MAG: PTS sorbitol transporter subunit IIA [Pseudonocardiaceae bacterium]|nr:PTS sorbitol transporter subunit IIA [Pseudonocardiaceae bacterium]
MTSIYYQSAVSRIGEEAAEMLEAGVWILYAEPVPDALESVSIVHSPSGDAGREMRAGDRLWLGDESVELTAVGERANENLHTIGHVVLYFDPGDTQLLPGAVHAKGSLPAPSVGTRIALSSS